jgi:hypothetical protein
MSLRAAAHPGWSDERLWKTRAKKCNFRILYWKRRG